MNKKIVAPSATSGIVYVLTNASIQGLVKIGQTTNLEARLASLNRHSGVALPFECHFAAYVEDRKKLEATLHRIFAPHRKSENREFFEMAPERVVLAIGIGQFEDVTPTTQSAKTVDEKEGLKALKKAYAATARRSKTLISQLDIPIGSVLTFSRDDSIRATVIKDNKIQFEGKDTSLSAAALIALKRLHYKSRTVNGAAYWMYDNELLTDRRLRLEIDHTQTRR